MFNYKPYIISLLKFYDNEGEKIKPYPKVVLDNKKHDGDPVFWPTGYYEPESKTVVVYTNSRAPKDVLRSCAHEFYHHVQNMEGRLGADAYSGQEIVNDSKLIKLEAETYERGNIIFRSWTEKTRK